MTDQAAPLETFRALIARRAETGSEPDLAILTRAAVEVVESGGSATLPSLWAACRKAQDDAEVVRLASFLTARYATDLDGDGWVPFVWLVTPPYARDESTLQNTLTALQRLAVVSEPARPFIQRELGPLLIHVLVTSPRLVEDVADVVLTLADTKTLLSSLRARDAKRLAELLRVGAKAASTGAAQSAESAAAAINSGGYVDDFPSLASQVREQMARHDISSPAAQGDVAHWTMQAINEFLEQYATLEELTDETTSRKIPAQDIRITGGWASVGKLPIDFLERVLHTWRKLYADIRASIAGDADMPSLFVLAPARGSFIVRVLVDTDQYEVDAQASETIVSVTTDAPATVPGVTKQLQARWQNDCLPLVRLAADNGVDIEVSLAVPGPSGKRHRVRISNVQARHRLAVVAESADTATDRQEIVGVLEGANHRTGHFEMLPDGSSSPISGNVAKPGRNILLDKTIGDTYRFDVRRVTDTSGGEKWELHGLSTMTGEPVVAAVTREVLAPPPDVLTSAFLPQADSLRRITQVVGVVARGLVLSEETIDLSSRHIAYHTHAARCLLLLTDEGMLSPAGAILVTLPESRRLEHLAIQFEVSVPGQAWLKWAKATGVDDLDPKSAVQFLQARSDLKPSMVQRRGRTLASWARQLQKRHEPQAEEDEQDEQDEDSSDS